MKIGGQAAIMAIMTNSKFSIIIRICLHILFLLLLENVLFSDKIKKINQNNWTQTRTLVITPEALYNLKDKKSQRDIDLSKIGGISRNVLGKTLEFTVHVPSEYDYRFNSER